MQRGIHARESRQIYITPEMQQKIDKLAQTEYDIPSIVLMENAGRAAAEVALEMLQAAKTGRFNNKKKKKVVCVCGKGNNGGDGFVCARHLINEGAVLEIFLIGCPEDLKGDARVNCDILRKMGPAVHLLNGPGDFAIFESSIKGASFIIDAIFGIGLKGEVKEPYCSIIRLINKSAKPVLSIDVPSGLDALNGNVLGACIKASKTVTFVLPKTGFVKNKGRNYAGRILTKNISVPEKLLKSLLKNKIYA